VGDTVVVRKHDRPGAACLMPPVGRGTTGAVLRRQIGDDDLSID
jgi:hypothetical protein